MKIAMLSTGDEVLNGDIVDTNAAWLGQIFAEHDLALNCRITVGDNITDLIDTLRRLSQTMDIVIVNGGLGPTSDDLSAQAMADAAGVTLTLDEDWLQKMQQQYQQRGITMPNSNVKQAMMPQGAEPIDNPVGTACGIYTRLNRAHFYFTPGVPSEFKVMIQQQVIPHIQRHFSSSCALKVGRYVTFGLSESWLSDKLDGIDWPAGITLGYRSANPIIELKLICRGDPKLLQQARKQLLPYIEDYVVASDGASQAETIVDKLTLSGESVALAESCTGGMVASQLVAVPGSSAVFSYGLVSYSNQIKQQHLDVPAALLQQHGAVSLPVVQAMAQGALARSQSDYAIAISGIAGPEGGTDSKPVGTVAFALATKSGCFSQLVLLPNRGREGIRSLSAALALDMLRRQLEGRIVCAEYRFSRLIAKEFSQ